MSIIAQDTSVITQDTGEVECYYMGFDIDPKTGAYTWNSSQLGRILFSDIVDFALGTKKSDLVQDYKKTEVELVGESAMQLYEIKEFQEVGALVKSGKCIDDDDKREEARILRRGEFGELILYYILTHYWGTIPTLSKIYFKDSLGLPAHGFDMVHLLKSDEEIKLCLGEAKIYQIGSKGVDALIDDLEKHINAEFINNEFLIIQKRFSDVGVYENTSILGEANIDYLKALLTGKNTLESLSGTIFPFLCAYEDEIFLKGIPHTAEEFQKIMKEKIGELVKQFYLKKNKHPFSKHIQVVLILFPVKSKLELVQDLHKRLYYAQGIIK